MIKQLLIMASVLWTCQVCGAAYPETVEELCRGQQARVSKLFSALDMNYPGLEKVKAAAVKNDWPAACNELVEYYKNAKTAKWLRNPKKHASAESIAKADRLADGYFSAQGYEGKVPRDANGHKDWTWYGPNNELEYNAAMIRHIYFQDLFCAYLETKNAKYVKCIDEDLKDWILARQYPGAEQMYWPWWGGGLEPGMRSTYWSMCFFGLQDVNEFTPAARILMLSSILDQAHYLVHFGSYRANHVVAESYGLAIDGLCYPFSHWPATDREIRVLSSCQAIVAQASSLCKIHHLRLAPNHQLY